MTDDPHPYDPTYPGPPREVAGDAAAKEALKPCPFCGEADAFTERGTLSSAYVICNRCGAKGPETCQEDDEEETPGEAAAIRYWNSREVKDAAAKKRSMTAEEWASEISTQIVTDVSELADRTSPDDRPWELTVTADELALIAERAAITALRAHAEQARAEGKAEGAAEERERCDALLKRSQEQYARGGEGVIPAAQIALIFLHVRSLIRKRSEAPND